MTPTDEDDFNTSPDTADWVRNDSDCEAVRLGCTFDLQAATRVRKFMRDVCKHTTGAEAGTPFELLPWQWNRVVAPAFGWKMPDGTRRFKEVEVWIPKKNGKSIRVLELLVTPTGFVAAGDVKPGDALLGADGRACRVVAVAPVEQGPSYRVEFKDGTVVHAHENHDWFVKSHHHRNVTKVMDTKTIAHYVGKDGGRSGIQVPVAKALELQSATLPCDPYLYGFWLGNGTARFPQRISVNETDIEDFRRNCPYANTDNHYGQGCYAVEVPELWSRITACGHTEKRIPIEYARASVAQRWELLAGLMDSDGCISTVKGQSVYSTALPGLADDVKHLLATLGCKATVNVVSDVRENELPVYRVCFTAYADMPCSKLARKLRNRVADCKSGRRHWNAVVSCTPIPPEPMRCIQVDSPDALYLVGAGCVPTHNSTLMAAIALYLLIADGEYNAQIYGAASDKKQAAMIYDTVVSMYKINPQLQPLLKLRKSQKRIFYPRRDSSYEVLAADGFRNEGLNIHGLLFDEMHAQRDRRLWAALRYGSAARRQGIRFIVSTAGEYDEESLWWERFHMAKEVQENKRVDIHLLPCVYAMEPHEDAYDPAVWKRVNPSWGKTVNAVEFARDAEQSRLSGANAVEFKRYRLNYTMAVVTSWIPKEYWETCRLQPDEDTTDGPDAVTYIGIDLAEVTDLCAVVTCTEVADTGTPPTIRVTPDFWAPQFPTGLHMTTEARYDRWTELGLLHRVPGNVVRYGTVVKHVVSICRRRNVRAIGVDRYLAMQFAEELREGLAAAGLTVEVVLAQYTTLGMNEPVKSLEVMVYDRKIVHDGNAVLRYMFNNLKTTSDTSGNKKLDKSNKRAKIDGFAAICLALYAKMNCKKPLTSRYNSGGSLGAIEL